MSAVPDVVTARAIQHSPRTAADVFDRLDQNLRNGERTPDALRHAVGVDNHGEVTT